MSTDPAAILIDEIEELLSRLRALVSEPGTIRYTGCAWRRGTHSGNYVPDPLGTDLPPAGWPYPRPTRAEIDAALKAREEAVG